MRDVCLGVLLIGATTLATAPQLPDVPAAQEARTALGGSALEAISTIRITGRATRAVGPLTVSSAMEVRVALPDRYLRLERLLVGGATTEMVTGVVGDRYIQRATGPGGSTLPMPTAIAAGEPASAAARGGARALRQEAGVMLLGLFGRWYGDAPAEMHAAGIAEAPDGRADIVAVRGQQGFEARLFVDSRSRLPLMVSWPGPDVAAAVRRALAAGGAAALVSTDTLLAEAGPNVEYRMYFDDYRPVGDLRWPHRFRRSVAGSTVEEWVVERFTVNPPFAADAFEPQP